METGKFAKVKVDREITTHKDAQGRHQSNLHKAKDISSLNTMVRYNDMCVNLQYVRTIEKINTKYDDIICFYFNNGDYLDWKFKINETEKNEGTEVPAENTGPCPSERDLVYDKILEGFRTIEI